MNPLIRCSSAFLFALLLLPLNAVRAGEWHVGGNGDDARDGKTPQTAFRSLQKAATVVQPGDTVLIGDGIYTNNHAFQHSAVLRIDTHGRADAWITWKAAPGAKPELRPIGCNGIIVNASYQIHDGLTVTGANDSVVLLEALNDAKIQGTTRNSSPTTPATSSSSTTSSCPHPPAA